MQTLTQKLMKGLPMAALKLKLETSAFSYKMYMFRATKSIEEVKSKAMAMRHFKVEPCMSGTFVDQTGPSSTKLSVRSAVICNTTLNEYKEAPSGECATLILSTVPLTSLKYVVSETKYVAISDHMSLICRHDVYLKRLVAF